MSHEPELSGLEPRIGASSPESRRTFAAIESHDAAPVLTGLEPELGGSRRVATDPHLIALALAATDRAERERAVQRILDSGQARVYARELASIAPPYARRRIAGLWQMRYTRRQRLNAIAVVGALGQIMPDTIKPLFTALGGSDRTIQRAAIAALADLWNMDDLWELTHENPLVRQQAAESLAYRRDPRTIGPLLVSLPDEDPYVRAAVARALGQLGAPHAIKDLLKLLRDAELLVRRAAVEALGAIAASLSPDDPRPQDVVSPMVAVLRKGSWAERRAAAEALGYLGDAERAIGPLLAALRDRDRLVREAAASALGMLGDPRAFEPICALVDDVNFSVAQAAVRALGNLDDPRAVPLLLELLHEDPDLYLTAAHALGRLGDPRAVERLIATRQSNQHPYAVREAAGVALREIGTEQALAALGELGVERGKDFRNDDG